ncbi:MAG: SNF2 family DNA or RNA helicase [Desulforhopalus sp.]|jgi:SNF2 family DNA or RNA helicase
MLVKDILEKLFSGNEKRNGYSWEADSQGINLHVSSSTTDSITAGNAGLLVTHQHVALRMLVEQGSIEAIPYGFLIPTEVAVSLDRITKDILTLPPDWAGRFEADIQGETGRSNFAVILKIKNEGGPLTRAYTLTGPILEFSATQQFILTPAQQLIFGALTAHTSSEKSEYENLRLLLGLQDGQDAGANIDLAHFERLDIKAPESISIEAELDEKGNLILTPYMGQDADHGKIQRVLGQLRSKEAKALRVNNEILLFDEERLKAVHEVLNNRIIPKEKVKQFLKNPTAFINASYVDLEIGFSLRVHGVTTFKHAYFGETDESETDWFGAKTSSETILPIAKIIEYIHDADQLSLFKGEYKDAVQAGSDTLDFAKKTFDISDLEAVEKAIEATERKLLHGGADSATEPGNTEEHEETVTQDRIVVDIALNDENLDIASPALEKSIDEILYPDQDLDWSNYLRTPFPHQAIGVRWILGLTQAEEKYEGGLLADDMGLGKTFMALSAIDHLYKFKKHANETKKPCLLVAPLSLLQNWKDEVEKTFSASPFVDIVILQADGALPQYRVGGVETKQNNEPPKQQLDDEESGKIAEVKYSLKVGKKFLEERLDIPQRLVITTYQTLRDYQFSLCSIDWGMVVFDEAQNIKNPNILQTRAAKGLKSDFKLVATGTPVENSLKDFWCLMDTACPGHLGSYQSFRESYVLPILHAAGDEIEDVRGQVGRQLRLRVGPLMLRRLKEDNIEGLPPKTIHVGLKGEEWEYLPLLDKVMCDTQLDIYNATLKVQAEAETHVVLGALQRLRDVSLHPQLADKGMLKLPEKDKALRALVNESGKLQSILSVLTEIKKRKEKCIIFAVNKRLQQFICLALGRYFNLGPLPIINGDTKAVAKKATVKTRKSIIKEFEDQVGFRIIVMSPVAAGVGLTVVGANNVIHLERHWNPAKEAQATDRVYRIGQKKDVNIFVPILHHPIHESFDVNLHHLLSKKTLLKDAVVTPEEAIPNPGGFDKQSFEPTAKLSGSDLSKISWEHFEALVAELLFKEFGAKKSWLTQSGADYGADVLVVSDADVHLVQCKHTKSGRYDGYKAILEVHGARLKYEEALKKKIGSLILATNAKHLSANTRKDAKQYDVQILSYSDIERLLASHEITFSHIFKRLDQPRYKI